MKSIVKDFHIGKSPCDIGLHLDIKNTITGETIVSREADSLTGQFMRQLYAQFAGRIARSGGGTDPDWDLYGVQEPNSNIIIAGYNENYISGGARSLGFTHHTGTGTILCTSYNALSTSDHGLSTGHFIQIWGSGTGPGTTNADGIWSIVRISSIQFRLVDSVYVQSASPSDPHRFCAWQTFANYPSRENFNFSLIRLGSFTGINPTDPPWNDPDLFLPAINKNRLIGYIEAGMRLQYSGQNVTMITAVGTHVEMHFTCHVTNPSPTETITIHEVGIMGSGGYSNANEYSFSRVLLARDLETFDITPGTSLSVQYILTINFGVPTGGFLLNFATMLYRAIKGTSNAVTTIYGSEQTTGTSQRSMFFCGSWAGRMREPARVNLAGGRGCDLGILLGRDDTDHTNDVTTLIDMIQHGRDSGELLALGGFVDDYEEDLVTNIASFKIYKYFKNESGADITIKEVGLAVNDPASTATGSTSVIASLLNIVLIARHVLVTPVVVPDGEIVECVYRLSLEV